VRIQRFDGIFLKDFYASDTTPIAQPAEPEIVAPPPEPVFTQAELMAATAAAREEGFAQGHREGVIQGNGLKAEREQATLEALGLVVTNMQTLQDDYEAIRRREQSETANLALSIAKRLVNLHLQHDQQATLKILADRCTDAIMKKPSITLHLHPDLAAALEGKIAPLFEARGFTGMLRILAEPTLEDYDVRVAWDHGHMEQNLRQAWQEIESLLKQYTLYPSSSPPAQE